MTDGFSYALQGLVAPRDLCSRTGSLAPPHRQDQPVGAALAPPAERGEDAVHSRIGHARTCGDATQAPWSHSGDRGFQHVERLLAALPALEERPRRWSLSTEIHPLTVGSLAIYCAKHVL